MLPRSLLLLTVASLVACAANAQSSPYFACASDSTYEVALNLRDEIVLNNCKPSVTQEIIELLRDARFPTRPISIHWNAAIVNLTGIDYLVNVTDFEYSFSDLSELDLRSMRRLELLNLTNNEFHALDAIRLPDDVTLTSLDMSYNRVGTLQNATIPSTRTLYLRSNNIMQLDSELVLPASLVELDLTRNEIEDISQVAFHSSTLKILNLSINLINAISNKTFAQLPALQALQLECNKIFDIEPHTFDLNGNLSELNLRDNNLSTLKKGVLDNLVNLQSLDVSKNRLLRLTPDDIQNLNNLVHFSLSENAKLCRGQSNDDLQFLLMLGGRLKVLKISRLCLQYIPVTLTTSIRTLDLSANNLTSVRTGDLENFPFLETLDLSTNELKLVETDVLARLEYLQELYLQDNKLQRVPGQLPPSLRHLRLDGNRITSICGTDFHNLSKLSTLRLDSNLIASIESDAFKSLGGLNLLDISRNPIRELSVDTFEGANKVETLHASGLRKVRLNTTDLRYFPISELPNLRSLNLSGSPELAAAFLSDNPLLTTVKQLEVLIFDNCRLVRNPIRLRRVLPRIRKVSLHGNSMNCADTYGSNEREEWSRLTLPPPYNNNTRMKVRMTRRPIAPHIDLVDIRSKCEDDTQEYRQISGILMYEFWRKVLPDTWMARPSLAQSLPKRSKKLVSRSLTKASNVTIGTTQPTITMATFYDDVVRTTSAKLPTEVTTSAPRIDATSDEPASFFDWFPSLNESAADRASASDLSRVDESGLRSKHPGFLFVSCFILAALGLVIAPPCTLIHVYRRWRQQRRSQQRLDRQPNIEISSISAIVETEISLD